jgi:hypothetical protein
MSIVLLAVQGGAAERPLTACQNIKQRRGKNKKKEPFSLIA